MSIVAAGRKFHDRHIFGDTCTITRKGEPVFDPNTGTYTSSTVQVYSGECQITPITTARGIDEELGGEIVATNLYQLKLPWDTVGILAEDEVEVTGAHDPGQAGRIYRVSQVFAETLQTSRRIICEFVAMSETEDESSSS